jgi:glutamate-1-semialdehyde 2,1-aminomutase
LNNQSSSNIAGVARARIEALVAGERVTYATRRPNSRALAKEATHWWQGVPLHWMLDWGLPFPLFIAKAQGARVKDVDEIRYADFCLGDTGAMFGHSPPAVASAIQHQAARGLTAMLPYRDAAEAAALLARRFGLPFWQMTATASDANRCVLRWARGLTGRSKILVFNGCYHGQVDEAAAELRDGRVGPSKAAIGQPCDPALTTRVVEFNDLEALEAALREGDVACVLSEPALTNCSMVLPQEGFHAGLRALTRKYDTLLAIDETHTLSTALGGYTAAHGLEPDFFVVGKAIAGGLPCAVWGCSAEVAQRMDKLNRERPPGHSGMGTTLSGNALALAALLATLRDVMTEAAYAQMLEGTDRLVEGLKRSIAAHGVPWHVVRLGARAEIVLAPERLQNGGEAKALNVGRLEAALHLFLLNRRVLVTPFHNMLLVSPATTGDEISRLLEAFDDCLTALLS